MVFNNKKRERQKELVSKYIDGPVEFLIRHNITPNMLSYFGFLCSLGAAFFIAIGFIHYPIWFAWLVPFCMFFSGVFDLLDGEVARRTNKDSRAGAFLDSNLDRISDATIILGLIFGGLIDYILGYLTMFLVIMISYIRSRAENEGVNMKGIGLMERAERILFLMFAFSIESWIYFLSNLITGTPFSLFLPIVLYIFIILLVITVGQRLFFAFRYLKRFEENPKNGEKVADKDKTI